MLTCVWSDYSPEWTQTPLFQVGFQNILTLTYVDKFIDDVQLRFRDRYKNELEQKGALKLLNNSFEFGDDFQRILR